MKKKVGVVFLFLALILFESCEKTVVDEAGEVKTVRYQKRLLVQFKPVESLWREKKFEEALQFCQNYLQKNPQAEDRDKAQFALGYLYYDYNNINRNYPQAIKEFKKVLKLYPQSDLIDEAQYWIAMSYHNLNHLKKAIEEYERLESDFPQSIWTYGGEFVHKPALYWVGVIYQEEYRDFEKACLSYNKIFRKSKDMRSIDETLVRVRVCLRKIEQVTMKYRPLVAYKKIEKIWFDDLDFKKAIKICQKNLSLPHSKKEKEQMIFAQAFLKFDYRNHRRDLLQAEKEFEDFVHKFPTSELADDALFWLGMCSYEKQEIKKTEKIFEKILTEYPQCQFRERVKYRLAKLYEEEYKNYPEALKRYDEILKTSQEESLVKTVKKSIEQIKRYLDLSASPIS